MKKSEILRSIVTMISNFGTRDPRRDCWSYVQKYHPALWLDHHTAMREIDAAYQAKDVGRVMAAKIMAFDTFSEMIDTWTRASEQMTLIGRTCA